MSRIFVSLLFMGFRGLHVFVCVWFLSQEGLEFQSYSILLKSGSPSLPFWQSKIESGSEGSVYALSPLAHETTLSQRDGLWRYPYPVMGSVTKNETSSQQSLTKGEKNFPSPLDKPVMHDLQRRESVPYFCSGISSSHTSGSSLKSKNFSMLLSQSRKSSGCKDAIGHGNRERPL